MQFHGIETGDQKGVVDPKFAREIPDRLRLIDRDAHELQPAGSEALLQFDELGDLLAGMARTR